MDVLGMLYFFTLYSDLSHSVLKMVKTKVKLGGKYTLDTN